MKIDEEIKKAEMKVLELKNKKKELEESDTFKLLTNTAYLCNTKMFESWSDFKEWYELKHEQHWQKINDSIVEVTFKIKNKRGQEK